MNQITLRAARLNKKLTVKEVSEKTGIPQSTIRRWEKNSEIATASGFCKLLKLYGIQSADHVYIGKELDYKKELLSRLVAS